jgi:formylglycine-generating enzyme required for sulfatase activity
MMRFARNLCIALTAIPVFFFFLPVAGVQSANFDREPGFAYPAVSRPYTPRPFQPQSYIICKTVDDIAIDGVLDESSWQNAEWTERFGHIFMKGYKTPFLATRAKMLWDEKRLYAAVQLDEPNLMGHVFEKDAEIYFDNDIEMFIDVDNDGQNYIELEFNCLGTVWDMLLPKEYGRGGIPFSHPKIENSPPWDLAGLREAVRMEGTVNYPFDTDRGWVIELSIPWESLEKTNRSGASLNRPGSTFRLNFSRVEHPWPKTWPVIDWENRGGPCWDWTWSPNLVYNMHSCESWGRVVLSGSTVLQTADVSSDTAFPVAEPPNPKRKPVPGEMVKIRGGTYAIGPDETDPVDSPAGTVTVKSFLIDRYEATIAEYVRFLNESGGAKYYEEDMADPDFCGVVKTKDGSFAAVPGKEMYPIVLVKLEAARAYAAWAGKRLPTEFEWEIAAAGIEKRKYPWGNEPPDGSRANYDSMVGHPSPAGSYERGKTPEGVYDMAGNVWELVEGSWTPYAWKGPSATPRTGEPLMRGGSWMTPPTNIAAAYRNTIKGAFSPMYGFRCARDAE